MSFRVNIDRLSAELETLATFSEATPPAVTRVVFSQPDLSARAYFKALCAEAGLLVREDAVGNTFARWVGSEPLLAAVGTGSHIDAIPSAGMYDGTVGVLGGLEAIRALREAGYRPLRSVELIVFTSEEPTRFGIGCLGSRLLSGSMSVEKSRDLRDREGRSLEELRVECGFTGSLEAVRLPAGHYAYFVELHIEQGPLLEADGVPIGLVTGIAAPASGQIVVEGEGGHAGGLLMADRRDALVAAAELILAVERCAKGVGSVDTVATVGVCDVFPSAVNSVPSRVKLSLDVRDVDLSRRDSVLRDIGAACREVSSRRTVSATLELHTADAPAACSADILRVASEACEGLGLSYREMISRAYHDSLFMANVAPTAMIFIPCRGGVSHRPDEYASPEAIAAGVQVLAETLATLSARR